MSAADADDVAPRAERGNDLLRELASLVAHHVAEASVDPGLATRIGETVADQVRDQFGGQILYIRKGVSEAARKRWDVIWSRFNGRNHNELAREFGLSVPQLLRIFAIKRLEERKRLQREIQFEE